LMPASRRRSARLSKLWMRCRKPTRGITGHRGLSVRDSIR
jgi:hypothetical protein